MKSILITGCNRSIGLAFVKYYLSEGWRVYAACRKPVEATELNQLDQTHESLSVHALDVADQTQIQALADELANTPLDILLNNAGVYATGSNRFGEIDKAVWLKALEINTIAPVLMAEAFLAHLRLGSEKIIATLSSKVGSIDDNSSGSGYAYRSSKSAVNQVMKSLSIDLAPEGIKAVSLHPGWVLTDMGGPNALINTEQSVNGMTKVLDELSHEQSGSFINYDGSVIPW